MATPAEVKQKILPRLKRTIQTEVAWSTVTSAVGEASVQEKADIVNAIRDDNRERLGTIVMRIMKARIATMADVEAETIVGDNAIDFTEIDRVL